MLKQLSIKNYAIINETRIDFSPSFNVITGETGTGKSILLGALGLILGNRLDTSSLFNQSEKCIIEGVFKLDSAYKNFFNRYDIDYDEETIIRREISPNGKSRSFINDTPVTLEILKEFAESQIDIHTQHQTLQINSPAFQLSVLDSLAANGELKNHYRKKFMQYKAAVNQLEQLKAEEFNTSKEYDYLFYQLNEIKALNIHPETDAGLEEEYKMLNNADKIKSIIALCLEKLDGNESGIIQEITELKKSLTEIAVFNNRLEVILNRLDNLYYEFKDIFDELIDFQQYIESNPERLEFVAQRLDKINQLLFKHRLSDLNELKAIEQQFERKITEFHSLSEEIEKLTASIKSMEGELIEQADLLSNSRKKVIPLVEAKLTELLGMLGMKKAVLKIKIEEKAPEDFTENGKDEVSFYFSANPGVPMQLISKAASGGELSRIMLCIKSIIAGSSLLSTLIFDEIDQGVSGETAIQVAKMMSEISRNRQIICITHLPQIASAGDRHFLVEKILNEQSTMTLVKQLDEKERVLEIAKMIGGANPPQSAVDSAIILLQKK